MKNLYRYYLVLIFAILSLFSCEHHNNEKVKIGFSQAMTTDDWRKQMNNSMKIEASLQPDVDLTISDANNSVEKQIDDIEKYKQLLTQYETKVQKMKEMGDYSESDLNKVKANIGVLRSESEKLQVSIEKALLEKTLYILKTQKQRIEKYTLDARVAGLRLQEEFFLRGGRQL